MIMTNLRTSARCAFQKNSLPKTCIGIGTFVTWLIIFNEVLVIVLVVFELVLLLLMPWFSFVIIMIGAWCWIMNMPVMLLGIQGSPKVAASGWKFWYNMIKVKPRGDSSHLLTTVIIIFRPASWRSSVWVDKKFLRSLHHEGGLHADSFKKP